MESGSTWEGWFAAPSPFGQTTFTLRITEMDAKGRFKGEGEDRQGSFTVQGTIRGEEVEFVKDYVDPGNYKNVKYKGVLKEGKVSGKYEFLYKKMFISMNISESFEMTKI